jgi:hypothetical protein
MEQEQIVPNPISCSNCGTENPPDQDFCKECDQPLTGSADQGLRENQEAQDHGGLLGGDSTGVGGLGGVGSPLVTDIGATNDDVPPRT